MVRHQDSRTGSKPVDVGGANVLQDGLQTVNPESEISGAL